MSATQSTRSGFKGSRRLTAVLMAMPFGLLSAVALPIIARADQSSTGASLYLNLSGAGLNDKLTGGAAADPLAASDGTATPTNKKIDLGDVPFTVSTADSDRGWDAVLGGSGQYVVPLSGGLSLVNHGAFTKTQSNSGVFGDASANAGPGLAYRQGNFAISLSPNVGVTMQNQALSQIDYGVSSSVSKDLMSGLTATTTTGYTLQNTPGGDSRQAQASTSLNYTLPDKIKLGLGYQMNQTLSGGNQSLSGQQGPSVSAEIPISDSFKLGTNYSYNSTAPDDDSLDLLARRRDTTQTFGLSANWDVGAQINADVKLNAKVDVSRQTEYGSSSAQLQQAGSVGMQMKF